ncbi:MAG: hypothetical protein ABL977_07425 [Candidatus Eisenbacteria bacterium]
MRIYAVVTASQFEALRAGLARPSLAGPEKRRADASASSVLGHHEARDPRQFAIFVEQRDTMNRGKPNNRFAKFRYEQG